MASDRIERLRYFQRQFLGAEDFTDEQQYHRGQRRRHNLGPHTWGIVTGLELVELPRDGGEGVDVVLQPGLALDGYGRELVVLEPTALDTSLFASFTDLAHHTVWLAYTEERAQPASGGFAPCDGDDPSRRVRETVRFVIDPEEPTRDSVVIGGEIVERPLPGEDDTEPGRLVLPPDTSVPHQELPEDPAAEWLVRLGMAKWDPAGFFRTAGERLGEGRVYAGAVAAELLAPAGELRLRDRATATIPPLPAGELTDAQLAELAENGVAVQIDGRLKVARRVVAKDDLRLDGSALDLRDRGGGDADVPLRVRRQEPGGATGVDLEVKIGEDNAGENRFVVVAAENELLSVADDGSATLAGDLDVEGGLELDGPLDFDDAFGDKLVLRGTAGDAGATALGTEAAALYARAPSRHRWYVGVEADDGASQTMQLGASGLRVESNLAVGANLDLDDAAPGDRVVLRGTRNNTNAVALGTEDGNGTLYAKADSRHRWYIGTNRNSGGSDRMQLDTGGLQVQGTVNGRNLHADGNKLDGISSGAKNVFIGSGVVTNGAPIPRPAGFTIGQCRILLSIRNFQPPAFDLNENGVNARFRLEAFAQQDGPNGWTARVRWFQAGHGGSVGWITGNTIRADYLIIAVK